MMRVKALQPSSLDASRALTRINKAISQLDVEKKAGSMNAEKLTEQLNTIKEEGNKEFKQSNIAKAIEIFSSGIDLYKKYKDLVHGDQNIDTYTKIGQIYTNRALAYSK
jgi:hypothetical protein